MKIKKNFAISNGENENSNSYLSLQKYANIAFFLKKAESNEPNCKISEFINNEAGSIKLLCIIKKYLFNGEILVVNNKYINLNL